MQEAFVSKNSTRMAAIYNPTGSSLLAELLSDEFSVTVSDSPQALCPEEGDLVMIIIDMTDNTESSLEVCQHLKRDDRFEDLPIVIYCAANRRLDAMDYFDAGADDIIEASISKQDLLARLNKSVFHTIANRQLKSRLKQANEMAFSAMSDTSDLGVNIQFLVHCHECSNLDELAMLLFRTLSHYQLSCSLQLRSAFETKNSEENGLPKDLESRLLWELKDGGRYVDFGRRCVMNYGEVSLLVKNMPEDEKRFGSIKDNVFALLQGADARVKSIDSSRMLEMERDVMKGMSIKMQDVMEQVDNRYQEVMRRCADLVEDMAVRVDEAILFLDLTESQEETFSSIMQMGVTSISELFNEGIKIDESFRKLIEYLNNTLNSDGPASVEEMRSVLNKL
ncbi:MAG: response regulator [Ketobacter sp.]|nr:MAG: response regulator [Ketobacter sp.]